MKLATQATLTFITKIVSFAFSLIGSVFMTRLLGVEGQGIQAFIKTNVAFFSMLLGFNMLQALTYFIANEDIDRAKIRGLSLMLKLGGVLFFFLLITILYLTDSVLINFFLPEKYQTSFYISYILILFLNTSSTPFFHGNWQGMAKFHLINYILIISSFINAVLFGGFWYYSRHNALNITIEEVLTISLVIAIFLFLLRTVLFISSRDRIDFRVGSVIKPMFIFCGIGWMTGIFNFAVKRIDVWFIESFRGIEDLGYYALAASQVDILITLILPVTFVISPYITRATKKRQNEILSRFARITIFVMSMITILAIITLPWLIPLLYGHEFTESIIPAQILFIGGLFIIIRNIFSVYNIATDNLKPNLIATFSAFCFTLVFDYYIIPIYGILGASFVSTFAYLLSSIIVVYSVIKKTGHNTNSFLFINRDDFYFVMQKIKGLLRNYESNK